MRYVSVILFLTVFLALPGPAQAQASGPTATPKAGKLFRDCPQCPIMVVIPAGSYVMGSDDPGPRGKYRYELPAHKVTIPHPFAIGQYEVTFQEWEACHKDGVCSVLPDDHKWGKGRRPIMNISFAHTGEYLRWISKKTGKAYRLQAKPNGSTRPAAAPRPNTPGATRPAKPTPTAVPVCRKFHTRLFPSAPTSRTRSASMMCTAMSGNGCRIAGRPIISAPPPTARRAPAATANTG